MHNLRHRSRGWYRLLRLGLGFLCGLALLLGAAPPAQAYLDPGSGSYLLQFLIAGLLGASVAIKIYWRKIRRILGLVPKGEDETERDG